MRSILTWLAALALAGCATVPSPRAPAAAQPVQPVQPVAEVRERVVILVGIDGARPDYVRPDIAPVLSRLAQDGVSAAMRPSFPTKTFPNFWTIATGLRPDRTGIVGNTMFDAARPDERFTLSTDDPFWWNGAEPIWVTAERAGVRSATMFWPGSNVAWGATPDPARPRRLVGGARPSDWQSFNQAVTAEQRVMAVLDWMRRPAAIRPRFVTLYFDDVDTAGHEHGPQDVRTLAAMTAVDGSIGRLVDGLAELGQPADLVFVADHGMAQTSGERVVALDRLLPATAYRLVENGPYASIDSAPGQEQLVTRALSRAHEHMQCWPKDRIPARFAYGRNPRVPAWLCLAQDGWLILPTAPERPRSGGAHGYDDRSPDMAALFVASGPSFRAAGRIDTFPNVDVNPLLRRLLAIRPDDRLDGDARPFEPALR